MKQILLLLFLLSFLDANTQNSSYNKPNYKKIKKRTKDSKSELYYPKLMKKYLNNCKTMTLKEQRYLYYGFAFRYNYKPYASAKYNTPIRQIAQKRKKTKEEVNTLLKNIKLHLIDNPFDIEMLKIQVYAYRRLGLVDKAMNVKCQITTINQAIFSSGSGLKKAKAYHIIKVKHQDAFVKSLGFKTKNNFVSIKKHEFITLEKNDKGIHGIYFNLSQGIKSINAKFK